MLFATDGSDRTEVALAMLCELLHRDRDDVTVLTVVPYRAFALEGDAGTSFAEEAVARDIADGAASRLSAIGIHAEARVSTGSAPGAIVAAAVAARADLIVIGSRGRGLIAAALLGSTARSLARSSPLPLLVVRERRAPPRRILAAVDGSPDSRAAITALAALPLPADTDVLLVHVVPDTRSDRTCAQELLHIAARQLPASWGARFEVERGDVSSRILERAASLGADMIVLGARGTGLGEGFLQGSTADRVLSRARCAVLVGRAAERVRKPEPAERGRLVEHAV